VNVERIESFTDNDLNVTVKNLTVYESGNNALVYEESGHILIIDRELSSLLKEGRIPLEIKKAMESRCFFRNTGHKNTNICKDAKPEFFMVDLTNKCNMRCKYCLRDIDDHGQSVNQEVLDDICSYIEKYCDASGIPDVSVQAWGGEPLIELQSIIRMKHQIKPKKTKVHFSVETNGILLTKSVTEQLFENKIGIGVSIDGTEKEHDAQRRFANGGKTFQIVKKNLQYALSVYGTRLGIITTITKLNYLNVEDMLEFYATDLGVKNVKMNFVHKSSFVQNDYLCLSKDEIANTELRILNKIVELGRRGYEIIENNINIKLKNLLFKAYSDVCLSRGCCGGYKMVVFDMKGNYYPCELTDSPAEMMGSIYDGDANLVSTINHVARHHHFFREKKDEKCTNCPWYCYCKGGCTVRIMNNSDRKMAYDLIECSINTVLYPALIELALEEPAVINKMLGYEALRIE